MEADWEIEVGGDAPVIDGCWPGFVDLRQAQQRAFELPEARECPALADALMRLNAAASPVWTSKCDVWPILEPEALDPLELNAPPGSLAHGLGCYVDLLPRPMLDWTTPDLVIETCRRICACVRSHGLDCARLDLVVRGAVPTPGRVGLGVTAYFTACGASTSAASRILADSLTLFTAVFCADSTVQWIRTGE